AKAAIDDGLDVDLSNGLQLEAEAFAALARTEDRVTGMRSFLDHGPGKATFAGR
ncbi:MAG TPA: enoyl-CoA hydratase/isomerase family protein, partial [Pseudonocardiaceae bacterium]|nr:enoyl-CoA hydratase/isomerase family protein [Pseudonocardiaceae bacterium]